MSFRRPSLTKTIGRSLYLVDLNMFVSSLTPFCFQNSVAYLETDSFGGSFELVRTMRMYQAHAVSSFIGQRRY